VESESKAVRFYTAQLERFRMTVTPVGALGAAANIQTGSSSSTAATHHKHGAHALKGSFATVASNALGTIGSAHVAVSNTVQAALNNLKTSG
jgi:hypothetical protein